MSHDCFHTAPPRPLVRLAHSLPQPGCMMRSLMSVAVAIVISGCAGSAGTTTTTSTQPAPTTQPAKQYLRPGSAPGFDKRDFPGLSQMQVWMRESPYVWVGYYLPSPCYSGIAWAGNRAALQSQGWGLAMIYVGQQAANAVPTSGASGAPDCGKRPLTMAQGQVDGDQAAAIASGDGFARSSTIFLDVERSDPLPPELLQYVRGWMSRVLERGYTAGIYAHKLNAEALAAAQREVFTAAGNTAVRPFWVANSVGFELGRLPSESGYPFATMWQNPSDGNETWGGVTFRIDRNVASTVSPSG
jgi:hypothetical protein